MCRSQLIPASIDFAKESPLCTTLHKDGHSVRTVEHVLSALEATGVDNCRIEVTSSDPEDPSVEVGLQKKPFIILRRYKRTYSHNLNKLRNGEHYNWYDQILEAVLQFAKEISNIVLIKNRNYQLLIYTKDAFPLYYWTTGLQANYSSQAVSRKWYFS